MPNIEKRDDICAVIGRLESHEGRTATEHLEAFVDLTRSSWSVVDQEPRR